jgi:hypothetical protein
MYKIDLKVFTFLFRKESITRSIQWAARIRQPDSFSFFEIMVLLKRY